MPAIHESRSRGDRLPQPSASAQTASRPSLSCARPSLVAGQTLEPGVGVLEVVGLLALDLGDELGERP